MTKRNTLVYGCPRCSFTCQSGVTSNDGIRELQNHVVEEHGFWDWHLDMDRQQFLLETNSEAFAKICEFSNRDH